MLCGNNLFSLLSFLRIFSVLDLDRLRSHKNTIWAADFFGLATQKFVIRRFGLFFFPFVLRNNFFSFPFFSCTMVWNLDFLFAGFLDVGKSSACTKRKWGHGRNLLCVASPFFFFFTSLRTWRYRNGNDGNLAGIFCWLSSNSSTKITRVWGVGQGTNEISMHGKERSSGFGVLHKRTIFSCTSTSTSSGARLEIFIVSGLVGCLFFAHARRFLLMNGGWQA